MKKRIGILGLVLGLAACGTVTNPNATNKNAVQSTKISPTETEDGYEIQVYNSEFERYLQSQPFPRGYHTQAYLESRNRQALPDYNQLVRRNPSWNAQELYLDLKVDYGYEVHYVLFHYFQFLANTQRVRLGSFVPRG